MSWGMALMHFSDLSPNAMQQLVSVAREVVIHVVNGQDVGLSEDFKKIMEPVLLQPGACFVTLKKTGQLRGCIGTLEAHRPLIDDVMFNAAHSALQDPRFTRVQPDELSLLDVSVSVLTQPEALMVHSQAELIDALRPYEDGLILQEGNHRATYLPSVWEQLPQPALFVRELKRKAGLPDEYWSPTMQVWRYQTITQSIAVLAS